MEIQGNISPLSLCNVHGTLPLKITIKITQDVYGIFRPVEMRPFLYQGIGQYAYKMRNLVNLL